MKYRFFICLFVIIFTNQPGLPQINPQDINVFSKDNTQSNIGYSVMIGKAWDANFLQGSQRNQIFTDPYSGMISIIKPTDRTGGGPGIIVYQISDDGGSNWSPQSSAINAPNPNLSWRYNGRFPGLVLTNPNRSLNMGDQNVIAAFAIQNHNNSNWGRIFMARDNKLPGGTDYNWWTDSVNNQIPDKLFINDSGHVFVPCPVTAPDTSANGVHYNIFKSTNQGISWSKVPVARNYQINYKNMNFFSGFINKAGTGIMLIQGKFPSVDHTTFGYKKTTDGGVTWSEEFTVINWKDFPELNNKVHVMREDGDCTVTADGMFHFVTCMQDTDGVEPEYGGIYHFYTEGGLWKVAKVAMLRGPFSVNVGYTTTQTEIHCASDWNRNFIAVSWRDYINNIIKMNEIYVAYWIPGNKNYPVVSTNTPNIDEKFSKMSPITYVYPWFSSYPRIDLFYTIFGDNDTDNNKECTLYYFRGIQFLIDDIENDLTEQRFELSQNYPNPFNPSTTINYHVAQKGLVAIRIYDLLGRAVETLVNVEQSAGNYSVKWNGDKYSSGIYFYELKSGEFKAIKKMLLMK